jgi:hypothetical protein
MWVNMTKEEKSMYNTALKHKWDNAAVLEYAVQTAREEGMREERAKADAREWEIYLKAEAEKREIYLKVEAEKRETVITLRSMGMQLADIAKAVGLSLEKVEQLLAV